MDKSGRVHSSRRLGSTINGYKFDRFPRYDEMSAWLHAVAAKYPKLIWVELYGKSHTGRESRPPPHDNHVCTHNFCNLDCNQDSRVTLVYSTTKNKTNTSCLKKYLPLRTSTPPPR